MTKHISQEELLELLASNIPFSILPDYLGDQGYEAEEAALRTLLAWKKRPMASRRTIGCYEPFFIWYWTMQDCWYSAWKDPFDGWLSAFHWKVPEIEGILVRPFYGYSPEYRSANEAWVAIIVALAKQPELWWF